MARTGDILLGDNPALDSEASQPGRSRNIADILNRQFVLRKLLRPDGPAGLYEDRVTSLLNYVIFRVLIKPESLATSNFEPPTFWDKKGIR